LKVIAILSYDSAGDQADAPEGIDTIMLVLRTLACFILMLSGGGCAYLRPTPPEVTGASRVRELASVQETLQAADAASAHLLVTEIGRVEAAGFDAPIWRVAYRPFQADLKQVLVLAGLHGNETAGVDYVLALIRRLGTAAGSSDRYDMDIVPIINPWGWVHDQPNSPSGVDIAKDFSGFDSHEARVIRRFLRAKRYDLVLDLREDARAAGFYLWQYGMDTTRTSARIVDRIRAAGYPLEHDPGRMLLKPRNGIVDAPLWSLRFLRLIRQLSIAGYIRQNVSSSVFTVVTPAALPLADRIAMQQAVVEGLLAEYAQPQQPIEQTLGGD
jgi:hypothetical protein